MVSCIVKFMSFVNGLKHPKSVVWSFKGVRVKPPTKKQDNSMKRWESAICVVLSVYTSHTAASQSEWKLLVLTETWQVSVKQRQTRCLPCTFRLIFLVNACVCSDQVLLLAVGLPLGLLLLLLLALMVCYLRRKKKGQSQYEELLSPVPAVPACSAPMILVSQGSWATLVPRNKNLFILSFFLSKHDMLIDLSRVWFVDLNRTRKILMILNQSWPIETMVQIS